MTASMLAAPRAGLALALVTLLAMSGCGARSGQALAGEGKAAWARQDYQTAIVQFKSALQAGPGSADMRLMLGESLLATGDATGAAVELGKAIEQGANADQAVPLLASALVQTGDAKRLVVTYSSTTLKDRQAQASLKASLAAAWSMLGDRAKASTELDAAVAAAPDYPPVAMMRARQLVMDGQPAGALKVIDDLLEKHPQGADAWVLKGELLALDPRQEAAAQAAFRKALQLDRSKAMAHFSLVNLLLRRNDPAAARQAAAAQREALPRHPLTAYVDAQLALLDGDVGRARETMQKLMNQAPNHAGVQQLAGAIAVQSREWIQAETHYSKALQLAPDSLSARRELARVYLQLAQPRRALETLQLLLNGTSDDAESLALAGDAQLALGDTAAAEALFLRAARLMPDDARVRTSLALTHLARGDAGKAFAELASVAAASPSIVAEQAAFAARLRRREFDAALALADQIAQKAPKDLTQHEWRGLVHLARKDFVQARQAFEAELAADPKRFAASANLAAIDILEKRPDAARQRLKHSIQADAQNVYAIMALAELQSSTGAPLDEVKALLNQAIQAAPQQVEPRLKLIGLTLRKRLYKEALVAAQEALAALPDDLTIMDAAGRAQMEAGDVEQAISTFRKMAAASAPSGVAYTRLADIYKATGKRDRAEAVLRQALEVEPGLVAAQAALVELLFNSQRQSEALEFIQREQRESPTSAVGYGMEAIYHLRDKAPDAAVAAYRRGLAKTRSKPLAVALHRLLTRLGQLPEADQFAASWMQAHPDDLVFAYQVAEAAIGRSQFDEAERRLARLHGLEPNNALILNNLASVMIRQGKACALPYAQKAADLAPDNSSILDTLASALACERQFDMALSTQKRAVELAPESDSLRLNLAAIALKAGDKSLARAELTRLQALGARFKQQVEVERLLKVS